MSKNLKDINNTHINDKELMRLNLLLFGIGYLKKVLSRFTKILLIEDNDKVELEAKKLKSILNFEKEIKKIY